MIKKKGFWRETSRLFFHNKTGIVGVSIVGLLLLVAIFSPFLAGDEPIFAVVKGKIYFPVIINYDEFKQVNWKEKIAKEDLTALMPLVPYNPEKVNMDEILQSPSAKHPFGTDNLGIDILSRIIHGSKIAMSIGIIAMGIATFIGLFFGSLAGYFGGKADLIISRFIEIIICFPILFLILTVLAFLPPNIYNIMIIIGITGWTSIARLVRAEIMKTKSLDYVAAANMLGYSNSRILIRHILPNSIAPVLVSVSFGIAGAILTETGLSFLGFGVQPPTPSWGQILSLAREYPNNAYLAIFPGIAIFITVTGFNMIGEALRDATDPRLRN